MRDCKACRRPVKAGDATCPFCAAALPPAAEAGPAVRLAIGSAIAVAGCTTFNPQPVYGAPGAPLPSASASATPSPNIQPPYGAAPLPSRSPEDLRSP